jgi:type II secretory pathway pseudopilin PulG
MKRRRAISLIELLAVLSGCSIVLGLTASLLHQTMRSQTNTRRFFDVERNIQRLARQFRSDVQGSIETSIEDEVDDDGQFLRLRFANGRTVEYQRHAEKIVRVVLRDAAPTAREEYSLSETIVVDVRELESPERWELLISTPSSPPTNESPPASINVRELPIYLQVEAIPGRDLRHAPRTDANDNNADAEAT